MAVEEIGTAGVEKLRDSSVFIIGCGALGSLCAMYLAASGTGTIGLADFDTVDISNLQRQLFYGTEEAGLPKLDLLIKRIGKLNPEVKTVPHPVLITPRNAPEILTGYDFIIDATDNASSKKMVSEICASLEKPCTIGGVSGFQGQIMSWQPGCIKYSEAFDMDETEDSGILPCSLTGVVGPAAGIIASIEASEAIKHATGAGDMLYNKIFTIDLATMQTALYNLC